MRFPFMPGAATAAHQAEDNMELARIFGDYMVLQRQRPILIWGRSGSETDIAVRLNGEFLCSRRVPKGNFSFLIPPQEAVEDATLEIGPVRLSHVDIGEVWIAGGQSNMEFMLQYTTGGAAEIADANDRHLRCYTVGQYSFAGEREEGYKAWNPWDRWLPYTSEHAAEMTAVGIHFAQELRKSGIPVGIISCNWGGTSAAAWTDREYLLADPELKGYAEDFDTLVAGLDLERYHAIKKLIRPAMASRESQQTMGRILKYTFRPGELERQMMSGDPPADARENPLAGLSIADIMAAGPGDPHEPGALYANMVTEIAGFSVRGVIWYQGETDEAHAEGYARLFRGLTGCWRRSWRSRNPEQDSLPFLTVQLAPFGTWRGGTGERFPVLRAQQALAARTIPQVYMASASDSGNIYDIHPKEKKPLGHRLALLAQKYVYGQDVPADAPRADALTRAGEDAISVHFQYGEGLCIRPVDFSTYNGFPTEELPAELLPPVLDGINGLLVRADGRVLENARCAVQNGCLLIRAEALRTAGRVRVEFASTGFYQVNLYNAAGLPAEPFILEHREE